MEPKIIYTVNNYEFLNSPRTTINMLDRQNADMIRINCSKDYEIKALIQTINSYFTDNLRDKLMLDLPIPQKKSRLHFNEMKGNVIRISPYNEYKFSFNKNVEEVFFIISDECDLQEGELLYVGDGEGMFQVKRKTQNGGVFVTNKPFELINGKAISRINNNTKGIPEFIKHINTILPNAIILSFVEDPQQILKIKNQLPSTINIISKIETQKGIDHIQEIVKQSDAVMLGRGDLALYSPLKDFLYNQNKSNESNEAK